MTKTREWPVRVMYMLIAAALAISLVITGAAAHRVDAAPDEVEAEWDRVSTPTTEDWVLAPESYIIDYAVASDGEVAYSIVEGWNYEEEEEDMEWGNWLLKSDDHAATWDNITKGVKKEISKVLDLDSEEDVTPDLWDLLRVATDGEDPEFLAVALDVVGGSIHVFVSVDGGDTFEDAGEVKDVVYFNDPDDISILAVSYENADGDREIAIGGVDNWGDAALFRCTVEGDNPQPWEDATGTDYDGWDDDGDFTSNIVTWIIFSPSWETDKTILVTTIDDYDDTWVSVAHGDVHLQCGSWGTSPGWNEKSTLGIEAVLVKDDVDMPYFCPRGIAGITEPEDYNSKDEDDRILWVWVNYYDEDDGYPACEIARADDDSADPVGPMGQIEDGELWLTNVDYQGTIAEGEAIAGVMGDGMGELAECCEGVQVYRNDGIRNMDICCERWHDACKPPTGRGVMAVSYVGEDKAYAVALLGSEDYEEGAWSWSFDDGDTWNQLSLIDTYIEYLSDVAVSPDCNKTMLVSVHSGTDCGECDSVWLHAKNLPDDEGPEYSGKWLRTWCGQLDGDWGLLRLAPEETTGDNVYLVDYDTSNVYWNDLETLACWDPIGSTAVEHIVDLAAQDADTLFALDANGDVSMFDDDEWNEEVDSEVTNGWTIAVWGDDILVGSCDGEVSYSADGGETFTILEDENEKSVASDGCVTVAFDSYFDINNIIYAGVAYASGDDNGVYRWEIGESEAWKDLRAEPLESQIGVSDADSVDETVEVDFTGLVLDNAEGNPMTSSDNGGVLYASYVGYWYGYDFTGVARYLTPAEDVVCKECGDWDYLIEGLTIDVEGFEATPDALKICGCLDATTNSKLFAIDEWWYYDMEEGKDGAVWMFEDCYAKKAPEITSPADGFVVPADPCACDNIPFTISWGRLCDACVYDIEFALDEEFTSLVSAACEYDYTPSEGDAPAYEVPGVLTCEFTYYYRVRAIEAGTGQVIRSWWTTPVRSVTIAPSTGAGEINLVSPEPGATGVAIKNVGFSWDLTAEANAFDWVLDNNSDFSSPVEEQTGLPTTAYGCTQELEYDTTYYWQVTAYNEGAPISTSAVGTFRTMEEPPPAVDHVPVETPAWVWVVIAIGAVLVIVVIVLIFRTRRV
jgi:hypothetical protein